MIVKLLTEHHLKFLSLKGGCRGSSESTHVKMPHCWKSHALAHSVYLDSPSECMTRCRLVPHVDKAPLPLRILRLVTSNFLPVENPTHPTAHAPERASVYILGQFRTSK